MLEATTTRWKSPHAPLLFYPAAGRFREGLLRHLPLYI